jgi:hypothetical protein
MIPGSNDCGKGLGKSTYFSPVAPARASGTILLTENIIKSGVDVFGTTNLLKEIQTPRIL